MFTVIQTRMFDTQARRAGITEEELQEIISSISADPLQGDLIQGAGGARKCRFTKAGGGKRGGYRTIHYYAADDVPVFLLSIYAKNQQDNISDAGKKALRDMLSTIADDYREMVVNKITQLYRR